MKDPGARAERSVKNVMEMNKIFHDTDCFIDLPQIAR